MIWPKDYFLNGGKHYHWNAPLVGEDEGDYFSFPTKDDCDNFVFAMHTKASTCLSGNMVQHNCVAMKPGGRLVITLKSLIGCNALVKNLQTASKDKLRIECKSATTPDGVSTTVFKADKETVKGLNVYLAASGGGLVVPTAATTTTVTTTTMTKPVCCQNGGTYKFESEAAADGQTGCSDGPCQMIISEVQEGSSQNKLVELFNPTNKPVALKDYTLQAFHNGGTAVTADLIAKDSTVELMPFQSYTICNSQHKIKTPCDVVTDKFSVNGDDALELAQGGVVIDTFGEKGKKETWDICGVTGAAKDHTIIRKAHVNQGSTSWAKSAGTDCKTCQWIIMEKDSFINAGQHTSIQSPMGAYDDGRGVEFSNADSCENFKMALISKLDLCTVATQPAMQCKSMAVSKTFLLSFTDDSMCAKAATAINNVLGSQTGKCSTCLGAPSLTFGSVVTQDVVRFLSSSVSSYAPSKLCCKGQTYDDASKAQAAGLKQTDCGLGACDLFISEIQEGTSYNKVIELFNPTNKDIALKGYAIHVFVNGKTTNPMYVEKLLEDKTIKAMDSFTICNNKHQAKTPCDLETMFFNANGDDAVQLFKGTVLLDTFGQKGLQQKWAVCGRAGAAVDHTLIRKPHISSGSTSWARSAGTDCSSCQWIVMPKDYFVDAGGHTHRHTEIKMAPRSGAQVELASSDGCSSFKLSMYSKLGFCANYTARPTITCDSSNTVSFASGADCDKTLAALAQKGIAGSCTSGNGLGIENENVGKLMAYLSSKQSALSCVTTTTTTVTITTTQTTVTTVTTTTPTSSTTSASTSTTTSSTSTTTTTTKNAAVETTKAPKGTRCLYVWMSVSVAVSANACVCCL